MAHRIIGIDVGKHAVRAVELEQTFRDAKVAFAAERPIPAGPEPAAERTATALAALAAERRYAGEQIMVAADDAAAAARVLAFPFTEPAKIDKALPFQLEGTVPFALEDMVRDHRLLERRPTGARVLVAMAQRASVERTIHAAQAAGLEPRGVLYGPAVLTAVARRVLGEDHRPAAVVEIGDRHTAVTIVAGGKLRFSRIVARGLEQVHHDVGDAFSCTPEEAEAIVRHQGEALPHGAPVRGGDRGKLDGALRSGLAPLGMEVKRTLLADRVAAGAGADQVAELLLCGPGALVRGIDVFLESCTGVAGRPLDAVADVPGVMPLAGPLFARALGLALSGGPGAREVPDFRRGDLAFKAATHFVRDRLVRAAAIAAGLAVLWGASVYARLRVFDAEESSLHARLGAVTKAITGKEITDFEAASREVLGGGAAGENPLPDATAYDLLREMSARIPGGPDGVVVDIKELDIKPKKTFIKGLIDKAGDEDRIVGALKEYTACFTEFKPGEVRPTIDKTRKEFSLTITSTCP
ncbi:MAG TPA: pilus assembly protein PilM [Myxococcota bacterium]|jgi:general secretion pathway protein L|nr:pilus assembly protein PilM [Myxococcota bacterium]